MSRTLQWIGESKLFTISEQVFEHDVQGVKDKKQKTLPSQCFYKGKKNTTKISSVYFVNQPLHVSGISVAHHQEVYCVYTTTGMC
jgi:hypothetical protein